MTETIVNWTDRIPNLLDTEVWWVSKGVTVSDQSAKGGMPSYRLQTSGEDYGMMIAPLANGAADQRYKLTMKVRKTAVREGPVFCLRVLVEHSDGTDDGIWEVAYDPVTGESRSMRTDGYGFGAVKEDGTYRHLTLLVEAPKQSANLSLFIIPALGPKLGDYSGGGKADVTISDLTVELLTPGAFAATAKRLGSG